MTNKRKVSLISIPVIIISIIAGCSILTVNKYETTGMKINGVDIVTLTNKYKKTEEYKNNISQCTEFVYHLDNIIYEYDSEYCVSYFDEKYMVKMNTKDPNGEHFFQTLAWYIFYIYPEVTHEELSSLGFLNSRVYMYVDTELTIGSEVPQVIASYSDEYYEENLWCMQEREGILYEDDEYEYRYTYESCDETIWQYVVIVKQFNNTYNMSLSSYIYVYDGIYNISWEDIEATGLGEKVAK